jgi:hypothetical protein
LKCFSGCQIAEKELAAINKNKNEYKNDDDPDEVGNTLYPSTT